MTVLYVWELVDDNPDLSREWHLRREIQGFKAWFYIVLCVVFGMPRKGIALHVQRI